MMKIILNILIILSLYSCATKKQDSTLDKEVTGQNSLSTEHDLEKSDFDTLTIYKNERVKKWIDYFTVKDKERFTRFLNKGEYFKEVIQTTLEEEGLPHELYYLPLIESGFNTRAYSHAGAVGPWQFIRGTGKRYGLDINSYVDERRDPILSTEAATKYLKDLYNVFNSWELAIAAYNCGEYRVLQAIMKGKTRNFWELADKKLLPRETRNYVPKFLAAALIGDNLSDYKIELDNIKSFPDVELVDIPGGISLEKVAKAINQDYKNLAHINQSLKRKITPTWLKTTQIWVSPESAPLVKNLYKQFENNRVFRAKDNNPRFHRVRKGEYLGMIARKYKVSLRKLKRINKISGNKIYIGQKLWLNSRVYKTVGSKNFYFVKRGDFLAAIAKKYRLSVSYLKKLNGLHNNTIYKGQKLDVSTGVRSFRYTVKRGDTLHRIARLYRISPKSLKARNSLRTSRIYIGQVLKI